jgi:hypothetical protein
MGLTILAARGAVLILPWGWSSSLSPLASVETKLPTPFLLSETRTTPAFTQVACAFSHAWFCLPKRGPAN